MNFIENPHSDLETPRNSVAVLLQGSYTYYHYECDGFNDRGWGCGYRTLQTICSWIKNKQESIDNSISSVPVPSILDIQKALVDIGDKAENFIGSREWIGSIEVSYVIDHFYKVPCRLIHLNNISDLKQKHNDIVKHFTEFGSPIMMGGDQDCSSKCILGISIQNEEIWLLILDPHYKGLHTTIEKLQREGWIKWLHIDSLNHSSFYNMCCPIFKGR